MLVEYSQMDGLFHGKSRKSPSKMDHHDDPNLKWMIWGYPQITSETSILKQDQIGYGIQWTVS